jgi:hypothetical protein
MDFNYDNQLSFTYSMYNLSSFKDSSLEDLLTKLLDNNFIPKETSDYPNILNKDFSFEKDNILIKIAAYVASDSPTCRKVKVGEEIQVVDKYEIQCD